MKAVYWFIVYLLIGIWSVIAPYALSFAENSEAFWSSLLAGALLVLVSAAGLYIESGEEAGAHFPTAGKKRLCNAHSLQIARDYCSCRPSVHGAPTAGVVRTRAAG